MTDEAVPRGLVGFADEAVRIEIRRSLLLLAILGFSGSVIDVGSGAGFPGLPLALCRGNVVLIEPRRKAVAFLERVKRELRLDLEIVPSRAQEAARSGHSADFVVARAVAPMAKAAALCASLCRIGGKVVITGSPRAEETAHRAPKVQDFYGLTSPISLTLSDGLALRQRVHIMRRLS